MLVIRLKPTGRVKRKSYRIVVDEKRSKLVGTCVEDLGYYNPSEKPSKLEFNKERLSYWQSKGAQLSDTVKKLVESQTATG